MLPRRLLSALVLLVATAARADSLLPPWSEATDLPVPSWAQSVAPRRGEAALYSGPDAGAARRGSSLRGARLPLYGMKRGPSCAGRFLLVGPDAWLCSDVADLSAESPLLPAIPAHVDGLPFRYFFVGKAGAEGYLDLSRVEDAAPDETLDPGFAVAVAEERSANGERWGRTHHGPWVALRELGAARPSGFHGEALSTHDLTLAWVLPEHAKVYSAPNLRAPSAGQRVRYQRVAYREEKRAADGVFARITGDGEAPAQWMLRRELAHPTLSAPPAEVSSPGERWIDVELETQTLVAYEGPTPVFATLVSTGRGARGTDTATPPGVHRIWVKLLSSTMDNLPAGGAEEPEHEGPGERFSIEDVPYVQFFDHAVGLHGAFWHDGFGRVKSHGCVNLAPLDAARLFAFTSPHLPAGWSAVLPTATEPGTLVRVR